MTDTQSSTLSRRICHVCAGMPREYHCGICDLPAEQQDYPVAVMYENGTVLSKADCGNVFDICCRAQTPLYLRPAAQAVKLPLRRSWSGIAPWRYRWETNAWNACLDAVAELNGIAE